MFYPFFCKSKTQIFISRVAATLQSLGLLHNHVAIRYVSRIPSNEQSFTVSYLINSCGLSLKSALAVSEKIHIKSPKRPDSVICFLKNQGFSQTQITNLIKKYPKSLFYNPDKNFLPKFQFFYSRGISSSALAKVLSSNPWILASSLHNRIIPNFNFFKDFTHNDDNKVLQCYLHCTRLRQCDFQSISAPNLTLLKDYEVPESFIMTAFVDNPRLFLFKHDKFRKAVEEVKKLGINPVKYGFLIAVQALTQMSKSTWEKKCNVFKQWGWSDEDIVSAFEKYPKYMTYSEHKITTTMDFLVNSMGLKSSYLANKPNLFAFSLERRIIPRYSVIQVLLSKGLIEKFSCTLLLMSTEEKFFQKFLTPYKDPYLLKLYKEKLGLTELYDVVAKTHLSL